MALVLTLYISDCVGSVTSFCHIVFEDFDYCQIVDVREAIKYEVLTTEITIRTYFNPPLPAEVAYSSPSQNSVHYHGHSNGAPAPTKGVTISLKASNEHIKNNTFYVMRS